MQSRHQYKVDNSAIEIETTPMSNPAALLASMRKGIKERPSERKRLSALANLELARAKWANTPAEQRKHQNTPKLPLHP